MEHAQLTDVRISRDVRADTTIPERVPVYNLELYHRTGDPGQNPSPHHSRPTIGDTLIAPSGALSTLEVAIETVRDIPFIPQAAVALSIFLPRPPEASDE